MNTPWNHSVNDPKMLDFHAMLLRALAEPDTVDEICRQGGWINPFADAAQQRLREQQRQRAGDIDADNQIALRHLEQQRKEEERAAEVAAQIMRCLREISAIEAQIRSSHPDLLGLCQGLADWNAELRLLQKEK